MKQIIILPRLIRWLSWIGLLYIVLFTLMRLGTWLFFGKHGYSFAQLGSAFFLGLRYDLRSVSLLLMVMLVLGSFSFLHPFKNEGAKKFWFIVLNLVTAIALFLFVVDFAYYAYLSQRLNASVLNYLEDARISSAMVWQSYPVLRLILSIILAVLLIHWLNKRTYRKVAKNKPVITKKNRVISFIVAFLLLGFFLFGRFNQYPLRWSDAFALGGDYKANIALNPFESFFNTLKFRHSSYNEKLVAEDFPLMANYYHLDSSSQKGLNFQRVIAPKPGTITTTPNIVLVICESFSAYKSSMWGNPLNTTPFFDTLCRNGIFFDHCFTPTYGTARGVWAVITGIPDVEMPTTASRNPNLVDQHTIINNFSNYDKFYFLGGSTSWANIRGLLTNNIEGLHLYEGKDFESPRVDVWGISDKNLFMEANKVLTKQTKPFFAVIQTADNHRPYTIPSEDLKEFTPIHVPNDSLRKFGFETEPEMNAFRYTDYCYRKFITTAKEQAYFKNTIFIFVGDHGITGDAGDMFPKAWSDQRLTNEHVPLLFYSPSLLQPKRLNNICSQVDILPTIAGLCNITYTNSTLGQDLLDSNSSHMAFIFDPDLNMTGVIKGNYYYRKQLNTNKGELVSIINNEKPAADSATQSVTNQMRTLSDAIYESAKYMLPNNKKKKDAAN